MKTFIQKNRFEDILFFLGISISLFIAGIYFVNYLSILVSVLFLIAFFKV